MMKGLILMLAFLMSWNSFSQTERRGKIKTEVVKNYELNYVLHIPKNSNVELTIFDNANHDSWSRVYDNQEIYDWMFQQTKNRQNEN
ncbi:MULTISPECIES: hypothetical protein [unclassified Flavobacterium]|uniref:hypothetical protein n=1 Tax=unclassified Flavobacterium TaxID=196869 RepID=UPI001F439E2C|nr:MULTISPECIES: hypothetical protein [unclassified Flavobacterium]